MAENTQEKIMKESEKPEVILEFSEESVSNVIYEESSKFRNSVSTQAYQKAFEITRVIVSANCKYQDKRMKKGSGTALRNWEQFFNIITFTGGRGTGKTSAMLSYMEFLKDYYRNLNSSEADKRLSGLYFKNIDNDYPMELMFTGLEYIDASLLGAQNDDILRNILPKMLKKWHDEERRSFVNSGIVRDEDYAYKKRQVQMLFNNVYKSLRDLNSKHDILESDNDMFMETLENLSLTWNLRQSFQELVEAYLDIMEYPGSEEKIGKHNHFLVISLDDLDMNIEYGFKLLEEVRKYLMVPNVIILLSANYEQLEKLCIEHYTQAFKETKGEAKVYIVRQSREYLEKILPAHCQVVMEPLSQWKYYDREKIRISYTRINNSELKAGPATLEKIIQKQLIDYFDVKFSTEGKSLRFFMPVTMRELALWVRQLYSLDSLEGLTEDTQGAKDAKTEKTEKIAKHRKNLQWFRSEKLYPLMEEYVNYSLTEIDSLEPEGQILLMKEKLQGGKEVSLLELLGKQISQTREEQVNCAVGIIYLTTKLVELFFEWRNGVDETQRTEALYNIKQYFNNGIWGIWEKKMMCHGVSTIIDSEINDIAMIDFKRTGGCLNHLLDGRFTNKTKEKFVERNQQRLINYQLLLMFFDFEREFNFSTMKLSDVEGNYSLQLEEDRYRGRFALSNIMRPWEDKKEILSNFLENFLRTLGTDEEQELGKKILKLIDIRGCKNNYIAMPLEDIEYLIRVGQELEQQFADREIDMNPELIRARVTEYFSLLRNSLEKYDEMYKTTYREEFDKTQIGIELQKDGESEKKPEAGLLYMLSESIYRAAVPKAYGMID